MIALIDYHMGNLLSVAKAVQTVGGELRIIDDPAQLDRFDRCILPGVGNFGEGMEQLERSGFAAALRRFAASGRPLLGICLGMQMMLDSSEEAPGVTGLGLISGAVRRFRSEVEKVPHMGWNDVEITGESPFLAGIGDGTHFYFVHSFYAEPADPAKVLAVCRYIRPFAAAIGGGSIIGAQFHPEKSQRSGLRLLENFVKFTPEN